MAVDQDLTFDGRLPVKIALYLFDIVLVDPPQSLCTIGHFIGCHANICVGMIFIQQAAAASLDARGIGHRFTYSSHFLGIAEQLGELDVHAGDTQWFGIQVIRQIEQKFVAATLAETIDEHQPIHTGGSALLL